MLDSTLENDRQRRLSPWSTIGRPAGSAREKILLTATELFCRNGFEAIGVDTITQRSGASKSTLYKHFASKEKLIEAVLEAEGAAWRRWFYGELSKIHGGPRARLLGVFDVLQAWFSDPNYYGCPYLNAISEAACDDERSRALADVHKSYLLTWLQSQALELGRDPSDLTRSMIVLIDGSIMAAHASRDATFAAVAQTLAAGHLAED
ncbi:MAG: TetR/AcrR family transcriptional regulator [Pseudomonadota bacterium]